MPDSVKALTDRDGHRRCLGFTGQRGEFLDKLVRLSTLDVEARQIPFCPLLLPRCHLPWRIWSDHRGAHTMR